MKIILKPNAQHLRRLREIGEAVAPVMSDPLLLRMLGSAHRDQMREVFATEGAEARRGPWPALNPRYAARKRKAVGGRKILHLTGDTRDRFISPSDPAYVQQFIPTSKTLGLFRFGARSDVAAAHLHGNPGLAPRQSSALARKVFGGLAPRLPVRDMITKTERQLAELRAVLKNWYLTRVKQALRGAGAGG